MAGYDFYLGMQFSCPPVKALSPADPLSDIDLQCVAENAKR